MTPSDPIIEARDLGRRFEEVTAIEGLTFDVRRGELFGLVGPDGAGKTTTLRMLAGVLPPSAGDALVSGTSIARDPERVKPRLAYMSQRFGLYADLTVIENITFYADLYQVPRAERAARLERLFRFSGLEPFRDRLAGRLSGGMKQKLGLSCALIHQPEILLLDEPTFGVDPASRRDLWLIVHDMVAQGVTAVVSTAYMDEAERMDRIALLHHGDLMALDTPAALQATLANRVLSVKVKEPRLARDAASGAAGVRRATIFGDALHLIVDDASRDRAAVEEILSAAGHQAEDVQPIGASLEDVFIDRMGKGGGT